MDTTAFNSAKDEMKKQLDAILSGAGDDLKVLAKKNMEHYMDRVRIDDEAILHDQLNEKQAEFQLQLEKNTLESFLLAEKTSVKRKQTRL